MGSPYSDTLSEDLFNDNVIEKELSIGVYLF